MKRGIAPYSICCLSPLIDAANIAALRNLRSVALTIKSNSNQGEPGEYMIIRRLSKAAAQAGFLALSFTLATSAWAEGPNPFNYVNVQIVQGEFDAFPVDYTGHSIEFSNSAEEDPVHVFLDYVKFKSDTFSANGSSGQFELDLATFGIGLHKPLGESETLQWFANITLKRAELVASASIPGVGNGAGSQSDLGGSVQLGAVATLFEKLEVAIKGEYFSAGDFEDSRISGALAYRVFGNFDLTAQYENYSDFELGGYRVGLRWTGF